MRERLASGFESLQSFGLVLLLVALPYSEGLKNTAIALAFLGFAGKTLLGRMPRFQDPALAWALLAYVAACFLSFALARPELQRPPELLTVLMTTSPFFLAADACSRRPSRALLFTWAILIGALLAGLAAYGSFLTGYQERLSLASIENPVPAAEYLAIALGVSLALLIAEYRAGLAGPLLVLATGFTAVPLVMTRSRGGLLGAACGGAAIVAASLRRRRYAVVALVVVAGLVATFALMHPNSRLFMGRNITARFDTWQRSVELIAERPLTGHGPGIYWALGVTYEDHKGEEHQLNAHNTLFHAAAENGLVGAGALAAFLVLALRAAVRSIRGARHAVGRAVAVGALAGIVASIVAGLTAVSTDAEPGMLFYALVALGATRHVMSVPPSETGTRDGGAR